MRGVRYDDLQELEVAMDGQVKEFEHGCLTTRIEDLLKCWKSVIEDKGYQFEGILLGRLLI